MLLRRVIMLRVDTATNTSNRTIDCIAEEVPLQITLNNLHAFVIWCSPSQFEELAVGHLFAEDLLQSVDEIENITVNPTNNTCQVTLKANINLEERIKNQRTSTRIVPLIKTSTSAYQKDDKLATVQSNLTIKAQTIIDAISQINQKAHGFKETGGLHDSAIFQADGTMVAFSEDVGRHNTVDKVIGEGVLKKIDFTQCFLIITGRVPGDMIYKAAKAGLPIVASVAAVLNSGVDSAQKANITLIGFVRNKHMNIYTCPQRITL
ncbi:formate dehydrogenase accessory sulfurtransferase FdhD [Candidatus Bathycorpusculum sp.]|uniref:formate dehydrogenase accessory sulfurtransferase FdhD n=1 Tax=Candidatus Bathycorpusculum sp. TaxID=2994959 RepID=UPI002836C996|nr:formate dehydrogenase accessory sulfurtransferase FdhD [Candidatus Termitimicrobium sp.]